MLPTLALRPPTGPEWLHEAKLDGYRAQVHVEKGAATLYSRNGADLTKRFRALRNTIEAIPAKSAIIDCELVACGTDGLPCFKSLMELGNRAPALCLWCFDLLFVDGVLITPMTLTQRREILNDLVNTADDERLQFSGEFANPERLLGAGEKTSLEGHRLETARFRLSIGSIKRLAEDQDGELAGNKPGPLGDVSPIVDLSGQNRSGLFVSPGNLPALA